ncbi:transcriptional regulator family: Fungal Specific TF [Penicillium atrosanguineum]|nr:transcriptional regulator family: Fungal Specific TF [Penicillium atrosanguineum]
MEILDDSQHPEPGYHRADEKSGMQGNGFTVESGFIPPVYYTALKCRVPRIRRQAIRTLRSAPHREGVWNGPLLADVLEVVIGVEEGDFYAGKSFEGFDEFIDEEITERDLAVPKVPEERRVSDVKVILPDKVAGDTFVSYKKAVDGRWVTFEKKVEPGVLRGWKLHFEGPEVTIGGLWKGMSQ